MHTRYIPDQEVKNFFCASNLVVQPYHTATQSGVTQIAYHFSKPMIVTRVGGLAEMVEDKENGYVVAPSPDEIATAILDFFKNNRELSMSAKTSSMQERFSWKSMVNGILELGNQIQNP
jgi:glycosyltransferase involved in cell wall biosynthesis